MSTWYAHYLLAGDLVRDRLEEAERHRLARGASAGSAGFPHGTLRRPGRDGLPTIASVEAGARARQWTLRLARFAVSISLESAAHREVRS
jgi:hypothetical protein